MEDQQRRRWELKAATRLKLERVKAREEEMQVRLDAHDSEVKKWADALADERSRVITYEHHKYRKFLG